MQKLSELTAPDERTLHFTPMGLSPDAMPPEEVAEWLQLGVARAALHAQVPEGVRRSFERLRTLHDYGVLCYDLFTVAEECSRLVLEQALRTRFISFYGGAIPIVDGHGNEEHFTARSVGALREAFGRGGPRSREGWRLRRAVEDQRLPPIPLTLRPLLAWARSEGLLDGQRTRIVENVLARLRNDVAHPDRFHLVGPQDSALAIRDLAEIINRLWGEYTEGGRLYPAPISREVCLIGWLRTKEGVARALLRPEQLSEHGAGKAWTYIIIRAVPDDGQLLQYFDVRYEMTYFPSELLWGPGTRDASLAWLDAETPKGDKVQTTDRLFALQITHDRAQPPRRPEVFLGLSDAERAGEWYLLRADDPLDALVFVRGKTGEVPIVMDDWLSIGPPLEVVCNGTSPDVEQALRDMGIEAAEHPPGMILPGGWRLADDSVG